MENVITLVISVVETNAGLFKINVAPLARGYCKSASLMRSNC